ncbi:MAG: AAA family ATPase [Oscillospiraceae bacterium]|nr:AAA family ATPase [Oscillospiraceae bacterium]
MYLKTLEMQGFKSFPDKTKMDFGKKVTVIVGPNGSGKSNISDAVRWALGEQSAKSLRGGKMEDVIFNGAAERNPHGFAEVCLTIDNSDGTLISQDPEKPYGDEVTVSRKYYRNGESEYRINSEIARLKDVHEIFLDTGLGKDGYSIIGQGRIAEIVSSKPVQRREMFEEAAGISKFRLRKEEAEKRLELAQENVLRLTDILSELESRVEPLRVQSVKAEKFLKLSEAKKTLEISLWVEDIRKLQRKIAEREDRILLVRDDYEKAEKEYDEIEKEIDKIFSSTQSLTAEVEEIRRRSREIEGKVNENESETAVLKNDIQHNERSIEKADEEISQSRLENDDIEKSCEAAQKEIAEEEGKKEKIFAEKEIIENKLLQIENEEKEISENLLKSEEYETELGKK